MLFRGEGDGQPLALGDYQPRSKLHAPETRVPRPRFPVIDTHVHLSSVAGRPMPSSDVPDKEGPEGPRALASSDPKEILALMERKDVRLMVNVTGGYGAALDEVIRYWQQPYPDRFLTCVEPWWTRTHEPGYAKFQADELQRSYRVGARGLKILKTLGVYLREKLKSGPLVKIDDPRFDPMWETAGVLKMPVLIHTADPEGFFAPVDRFNENYLSLEAHPEWSFHGRDFPGWRELHEARNRVVARHPRTQFLVLHFGDPQNLPYVSQWMDRYPNMFLEFSFRIDELGRQPRVARKFFDKYQDRIMFGSDLIMDTPERARNKDGFYEVAYRFLETDDDYFDSRNSRWRIYGIKLPENILRKIYYGNAERFFGVKAV
jgi:predicted TIM-barrel fold metal-dependent hydrolase